MVTDKFETMKYRMHEVNIIKNIVLNDEWETYLIKF